MRSLRSSMSLYVLACLMIFLIGCTSAEWAQIADDAGAAAPDAIGDALANPNPVAWGLILASFLSGLVAKSAARGFGKGAVVVSKGSASGVMGLINLVVGLFAKKK